MKISIQKIGQLAIGIGSILLGFSIYNYLYGGPHYDPSILYMIMPVRWHVYLPEWVLYGTLITSGLAVFENLNLSYFLFLSYGTVQLGTVFIGIFAGSISEIDAVLSVLTIHGYINSTNPNTIASFDLKEPIPIWKPVCAGILILFACYGIQLVG